MAFRQSARFLILKCAKLTHIKPCLFGFYLLNHISSAHVACIMSLSSSLSFNRNRILWLPWVTSKLFPPFPAKGSNNLLKICLRLVCQMSIHLQILEAVSWRMTLLATRSCSQRPVLLCPPEAVDLTFFKLRQLIRVMRDSNIWHQRGGLNPVIHYRTLFTDTIFHAP